MGKFIKENWLKIVVVVVAIVLISLSLFYIKNEKQNETSVNKPVTENIANTQIANPASVNCTKNGGRLSIVDKPEGQVGMCTFSNGIVCEEWAYFRGECQKK